MTTIALGGNLLLERWSDCQWCRLGLRLLSPEKGCLLLSVQGDTAKDEAENQNQCEGDGQDHLPIRPGLGHAIAWVVNMLAYTTGLSQGLSQPVCGCSAERLCRTAETASFECSAIGLLPDRSMQRLMGQLYLFKISFKVWLLQPQRSSNSIWVAIARSAFNPYGGSLSLNGSLGWGR